MNKTKYVIIHDSEFKQALLKQGVFGEISVLEKYQVPNPITLNKVRIKEVWRIDEKGLCDYQYKMQFSWQVNDNN